MATTRLNKSEKLALKTIYSDNETKREDITLYLENINTTNPLRNDAIKKIKTHLTAISKVVVFKQMLTNLGNLSKLLDKTKSEIAELSGNNSEKNKVQLTELNAQKERLEAAKTQYQALLPEEKLLSLTSSEIDGADLRQKAEVFLTIHMLEEAATAKLIKYGNVNSIYQAFIANYEKPTSILIIELENAINNEQEIEKRNISSKRMGFWESLTKTTPKLSSVFNEAIEKLNSLLKEAQKSDSLESMEFVVADTQRKRR